MNQPKFGRRVFFGLVAALCGVRPAPPPVSGGIAIPFACLPVNTYIRGPRYRVVFDRIVLPRVEAKYRQITDEQAVQT
jgi:hypothetical protein